jgi:hypothetical protein
MAVNFLYDWFLFQPKTGTFLCKSTCLKSKAESGWRKMGSEVVGVLVDNNNEAMEVPR